MILVLKSDVTFWGQNFISFDNYCDNEALNCHTVCFTDGCRYSLLFVSSVHISRKSVTFGFISFVATDFQSSSGVTETLTDDAP